MRSILQHVLYTTERFTASFLGIDTSFAFLRAENNYAYIGCLVVVDAHKALLQPATTRMSPAEKRHVMYIIMRVHACAHFKSYRLLGCMGMLEVNISNFMEKRNPTLTI